jgi:site-specific recombinase XerD
MLKRLSELINLAEFCLEDLGLSEGTIKDYRYSAFHPLERILGNNEYVDSARILSQEEFFRKQYDGGIISRKTFNWRIRGIRILAEVYETGTFEWKVFSKNEKAELPEPFGSTLQSFLLTKECGQKRKSCIESICRRFLLTVEDSGVKSFNDITPEHIRNFMVVISDTRAKSMDDVIGALRSFFKYLCENDFYHDNFWMLLAAPRCRDHHVLESVSPDETSVLLESIDTGTPPGKRDYAILSLAAVSGLRAGDIASLRLGNIDWKRNEIRLVQGKTAEPLVLPIPKAVLQAVADYILNGRPHSKCDCVFLRHLAPFKGYHDGVSVACIFRKYHKKAGFSHKAGDGKTLHGMRRGIATEMTASGIPIETVAQVLGHKDAKATKQYIAADLPGLHRCVLDFSSLGGVYNEPS